MMAYERIIGLRPWKGKETTNKTRTAAAGGALGNIIFMKHVSKLLSLLFAIIICKSCDIQSEKIKKYSLISDSIIYQAIQEIIYSDTTFEYGFVDNKLYAQMIYPSMKPGDSSLLKNLDTILSKEDYRFIISQITQQDSLKLESCRLPRIKFIPNDSLIKWSRSKANFWELYYRNYRKGFNTVGFPYFSKDLKKCIISLGSCCGGLCGSWEKVLFEKRNGKWEKIKTIFMMVS